MSTDINTINNSETPNYSEANPVASPCNPDLHKGTFRSKFNWCIFIFWLLFMIFLIPFIVILVNPFRIIPLIAVMIAMIGSSLVLGCMSLQIVITVDPQAGKLTIKEYSTCIFFWKRFKCDLKDIQKIYSIQNKNMKYEINDRDYPSFDIIIELSNGEKKKAVSGEIDIGDNKKKILEFFYKFLPTVVDINCEERRVNNSSEVLVQYTNNNTFKIGYQNPQIPTSKPIQYPDQQTVEQSNYSTPQNILINKNVENMDHNQNELNKQLIDKPGDGEAPPTTM